MTVVKMVFSWIITLILPFILLMTSVRALLTPVFVRFEYNTPWFPPDSYGFTLQDRLKWSQISLDYLLNSTGPSFLADQRLPDGSPLYNERELSHMVDVKNLVQKVIGVWYILLAVLLILGLWAWRGHWWPYFWLGISRGGWLTIGIIILILLAIFINFNTLFTDFHRIFFTGNSWIFLYSDTLIRLFPLRFWQDAFTLMGAFTLLAGLVLALVGRKLSLN
jgi:integral membrane protein (TIGR01906 family)